MAFQRRQDYDAIPVPAPETRYHDQLQNCLDQQYLTLAEVTVIKYLLAHPDLIISLYQDENLAAQRGTWSYGPNMRYKQMQEVVTLSLRPGWANTDQERELHQQLRSELRLDTSTNLQILLPLSVGQKILDILATETEFFEVQQQPSDTSFEISDPYQIISDHSTDQDPKRTISFWQAVQNTTDPELQRLVNIVESRAQKFADINQLITLDKVATIDSTLFLGLCVLTAVINMLDKESVNLPLFNTLVFIAIAISYLGYSLANHYGKKLHDNFASDPSIWDGPIQGYYPVNFMLEHYRLKTKYFNDFHAALWNLLKTKGFQDTPILPTEIIEKYFVPPQINPSGTLPKGKKKKRNHRP